MNKEYEKKMRLKSSGYDMSNLYDLSKSLIPYITELNSLKVNDNVINFSFEGNKEIIFNNNGKKYTIPNSLNNSNILISSNKTLTIDLKNSSECLLNSPSGKITIINGNCFSGQYIKFKLNNSFIKNDNNVLLTINNFDISNVSIPVCLVENIENGNCIMCVYNSGINDLPNSYDIVFLII